MTMAQDGGKVVSLTHRPLLPPRNTPLFFMCKIYRAREELARGGVYVEFTHKFLLECFDQNVLRGIGM